MAGFTNLQVEQVRGFLRVLCRLDEVSVDLKDGADNMIRIIRSTETTDQEKRMALHTLAEVVFEDRHCEAGEFPWEEQ